tara:strand:+ start:111 stop:224 length:114 start_codon:yes stop_codon:yes gene_type:complete
MKKLINKPVVQNHIIPTAVVLGWFLVILVVAVKFLGA